MFGALSFGCSWEGDRDPPVEGTGFDAGAIVENGDGYTFRRVSGAATEALIEQSFGAWALDEAVSVIVRKAGEPVGPTDVMVLNESITPQEWVDRFYADLMQQDVSEDVGADAIVFTGAVIGVVMECRTDPEFVLIRGSATHREPLVELMSVLAERCS